LPFNRLVHCHCHRHCHSPPAGYRKRWERERERDSFLIHTLLIYIHRWDTVKDFTFPPFAFFALLLLLLFLKSSQKWRRSFFSFVFYKLLFIMRRGEGFSGRPTDVPPLFPLIGVIIYT
jgi:hypothetical protein